MQTYPDTVDDLIDTLNTVSLTPDAVASDSELYSVILKYVPRDVRIRIEKGVENPRFVLTTNRLKSNYSSELLADCNGLIIAFNRCTQTWRVLVAPPRAFNANANIRYALNNLDKYNVYHIEDGTIVNLYKWNGKWNMGSANGFDISDYKWFGDKTYRTMFTEIAARFDIDVEKLNPAFSYTFGFRHHDIHPLKESQEIVWFIHSYNANDGTYNRTLKCDPALANSKIVEQMPLAKGAAALSKIIRNTNSLAIEDFTAHGNINYGYILRAKPDSGVPIEHQNIILESTLLRRIRQMVYNIPKVSPAADKVVADIGSHNRRQYVILRAFLSKRDPSLFSTLFPQFGDYMKGYSKMIDETVSEIIRARRSTDAQSSMLKQYLVDKAISNHDGAPTNARTLINSLACRFMSIIEEMNIDCYDPQCASIIRDMIMDASNTNIIFGIMNEYVYSRCV